MVMSVPQDPSANIFETGKLDSLRRGLDNPDETQLRAVAEEFETVFVGLMLKSMRAATPGDDLFGGNAMEQYEELHDQQLAMSIGSQGGLGIADMVEQELRRNAGFEAEGDGIRGRELGDYQRSIPAMRVREAIEAAAPDADGAAEEGEHAEEAAARGETSAAATPAPAPGGKGAGGWDSPQAFVRDVWPAAERAAERLDADPRALVAQAALETGWGQHVIRDGEGQSSFNLFGIKAAGGWDGKTVEVPTLEFREGIPQREMASFRSYESVEQAFDDYASFLEDNPRYADALEQAPDPDAWVQALQDAGYATDPRYAEKLRGVMGGSVMEVALEPLKADSESPITRL